MFGNLLSNIQPKEYLAIILSSLALFVSIVTMAITVIKSFFEVPKLRLELAKLQRETDTNKQALAAIQFPGFRELYRSDSSTGVGFDFAFSLGFRYKNDTPFGERGRGALEYLADGVIKISKNNVDGRSELRLKHVQEIDYSGERNVRLLCEARAPQGDLKVRFVFYDPDSKNNAWITRIQERCVSREWQAIDLYWTDDGTTRSKLRIDVQEPVNAPSFLLLRKLVILEKVRA